MPVSKYELYRDTIINTLQRDKKNLDNVLTTAIGGLKADMHSIKKALFMKKYHYFQKTHFAAWMKAYAEAPMVHKPISDFSLIRLLTGSPLNPPSKGTNTEDPQKHSFVWSLRNAPLVKHDINSRIELIQQLDETRIRIRSHPAFHKCGLVNLVATQPEYLNSYNQVLIKYENLLQDITAKFPANPHLKLLTHATTLHLLNTKSGNKFMH